MYTDAGRRDLVVLVDISGSMKPCIDALKNNISFIIDELGNYKNSNGESLFRDFRVMIAGYRDAAHNSSNWFVQFPFTRDVNQLKAHLAHPDMEAKGGGDEPESLLDALYKVGVEMPQTGGQDEPDGLKWRSNLPPVSCRKFIVCFTDASFKPVTSIPPGKTMNDVIDHLENDRVRVIVVAPRAPCYEAMAYCGEIVIFPYPNDISFDKLTGEDTPEARVQMLMAQRKLQEYCTEDNGEEFKDLLRNVFWIVFRLSDM